MAQIVREYGGMINTIEYDKKVASHAKMNFINAGVEDFIELKIGDIIKNKMNYFKNNINSETPNKQNMLLKEYISSINYNLVNDVLGINLIIKLPENSTETIFEKIIYASL